MNRIANRTPGAVRLAEADLFIVHNGKIASAHEKFFKNKAVLTVAHNYLWNVDERFIKQGSPGAVVGQQ